MAKASIPVDLFNPGQVFACMGFLEAADALLGNAVGGFEWSNGAEPRFEIQTNACEHPFGVVLDFLTKALAPESYVEPSASQGTKVLPLRFELEGRFTLELSGKNKIVTFTQEQIT